MKYFSDNLRRLATDRDISNAEVARRCGIEERTYANYCKGDRKPDLETLVRICKRMGVTPNSLLLEDTAVDPSPGDKLKDQVMAALGDFAAEELNLIVVALEAIAANRRQKAIPENSL